MILETTHINKVDRQFVNDIVGKPYSLLQKLKLKGVRSRWMLIAKTDPNLQSFFDPLTDVTRGKVQLRQKGIVITVTNSSQVFSWAIPYYQLVIYKTRKISIHAQGRFIQFEENGAYKENKSFFKKLLDLKAKYTSGYYQFGSLQ